jgi:hypothetical protein
MRKLLPPSCLGNHDRTAILRRSESSSSRVGRYGMKSVEAGIIGAIVLYGIYILGYQPLRQLIIAILSGLIVGLLLVAILRTIRWLGRIFRKMLPRTARVAGNVMLLLGTVIGAWMLALVASMLYTGAPLNLTGHVAGMGIFYFLWGVGGWMILAPRAHVIATTPSL